MGAMTALSYAMTILDAIPRLIQAGADITALITEQRAKIDEMVVAERDPTPEEWASLNEQIEALRNRLHEG